VIEVTKEAEHGGRVVKTRDGWEVKAVEVERHGEELGVEKEGKAQVLILCAILLTSESA
jgi:hypothetical protein